MNYRILIFDGTGKSKFISTFFLQQQQCYLGDPFSSGPGITISPNSLDYTYGDFGKYKT
jgi:hypothetical protein